MSDDEEMRKRIHESMGRVPVPPAGDLGAVRRRARNLRVRRVLVGSTAAAVVLSSVAVPLALLSSLGRGSRGPGGPPPSATSSTGGLGSLDVLRIAQAPQGGAYYFEGAVGYVTVTNADGQELYEDKLTNYLLPRFTAGFRLEPGAYVLRSYVRPCAGNCGVLDPPTEMCSAGFSIRASERLDATIRYRPGKGCTITLDEASPAPDASASPLPDVVDVVCDGGTQVLTPQAKPQLDGVHFRVDNRTGSDIVFLVEYPTGGVGAEVHVPPGISELSGPDSGAPGWAVPPGTVGVSCRELPQEPSPSPTVDFELVDEDGVWLPTTLSCDSITQSFLSRALEGPDPIELTRERFDGILETDVVEEAGYPEAASPSVVIIRDGEIIALANFFRAEQGGWLLDNAKYCSDSELSG